MIAVCSEGDDDGEGGSWLFHLPGGMDLLSPSPFFFLFFCRRPLIAKTVCTFPLAALIPSPLSVIQIRDIGDLSVCSGARAALPAQEESIPALESCGTVERQIEGGIVMGTSLGVKLTGHLLRTMKSMFDCV